MRSSGYNSFIGEEFTPLNHRIRRSASPLVSKQTFSSAIFLNPTRIARSVLGEDDNRTWRDFDILREQRQREERVSEEKRKQKEQLRIAYSKPFRIVHWQTRGPLSGRRTVSQLRNSGMGVTQLLRSNVHSPQESSTQNLRFLQDSGSELGDSVELLTNTQQPRYLDYENIAEL